MAAAEAAVTVVQGASNVPAAKRWDCKVIIYNTNSTTARTVTCGFMSSNVALVIGHYLMAAESLEPFGRREFAIRFVPTGYYFRANQGSGTDVQVEIHGEEVDV